MAEASSANGLPLDLADDHPKKRLHVARLGAHEMAHLWQLNTKRGGTGIMSEEASEQLKSDLASYRSRYACGFKRFQEYSLAPIPLWRALMVKRRILFRADDTGGAQVNCLQWGHGVSIELTVRKSVQCFGG